MKSLPLTSKTIWAASCREQAACESLPPVLYHPARGWRGQVPRQPGQVRKEAAVTSPTWVVVSLSPHPAELNAMRPALAGCGGFTPPRSPRGLASPVGYFSKEEGRVRQAATSTTPAWWQAT